MTKIGYAIFAAFLILFIPACATVEEVKVEEVVRDIPAPTRPMTVEAYCHDTPQARVVMKRIIRDRDARAYRLIMNDKRSPCHDTAMSRTSPLLVQFTKNIGRPFKNVTGLCIQFVGFADVDGRPGFSWMIKDNKCGHEA